MEVHPTDLHRRSTYKSKIDCITMMCHHQESEKIVQIRRKPRKRRQLSIMFVSLYCFATKKTLFFPMQVFAQENNRRNQRQRLDREGRRQQREERRQESRQREEIRRESQQQYQEESYEYQSREENYQKLFPVQAPRDILQATKVGIKSVALGIASGLTCLVVSPLALSSVPGLKGVKGLLLGFVLGIVAAAGTLFIGVATAVVHLLGGLWKTPQAIFACWFEGKQWDPIEHEWKHYNLDDEIEELLNSTTVRKHVQDTTYYDMLDLKPGASSKDIKRGYYSKAKNLHPDKNPGNEDAAAQFVQLHKAYQTLMDPDTREAYDTWGSSSSSANGDGPIFNVAVFFEILFGSQIVEPYIGQLAVSSFVSQIMKLSQMSTASASQVPLDLNLFRQAAQRQHRQRSVQIAQHLRERIQLFAKLTYSDADFRESCLQEANEIAETGFGETFLLHIGNALVQEADLYLQQSWLGWPRWMFSTVTKKTRKLQSNIDAAKMIVTFIKKLAVLSEEARGREEESMNEKPSISAEMIEEFLPNILEMAWAYNARDIASVIEQACHKLFNDVGVDSSVEPRRRAQALRILGESFVERGRQEYDDDVGKDSIVNGSCEDSEMNTVDIKARLEVAFRAAHLEVCHFYPTVRPLFILFSF